MQLASLPRRLAACGPEIAVVVAILLVAAFFRFYRLDTIPPGMNFDEASNLLDILDVRAGHHRFYFPKSIGREPLWIYFNVAFSYVAGVSVHALRTLAAIAGTATVLLTYLLAREMFAGWGMRRARWLAALTALGLATSYWHINFSRIGFRAIMVPVFETLCFLFLWRGLRTRRRWDFVLSGVFLGGSGYIYQVARFVPVVLLFFFLAQAAVAWLGRRGEPPLLKTHFWSLALTVLAAAVVFAPFGIYFMYHPDLFFERVKVVNLFNPAMNRGDFWGTLWWAIRGNLGGFGFVGEQHWLGNLPGRPIFGPIMAALFWLGVALCLARIRRPVCLFCLVWWLVMLLPSILAPERAPNYLRTFGDTPVAYVFPALALVTIGEFVGQRAKRFRLPVSSFRLLALAATVALFGAVGYSTFHDYFRVWAVNPVLYHAFDVWAVELGQAIRAEADPEVVYVLPRDVNTTTKQRHWTVDFVARGGADYAYVEVDPLVAPAQLTAACRGKRTVRLVRFKAGRYSESDLRGLVAFLLDRQAERVGEEQFRGYDVLTYRLPSTDVDFAAGLGFRPVSAHFGGQIVLTEAAYGVAWPATDVTQRRVRPGGRLWVMLHWQVPGPTPADYSVSLRLLDAAGNRVAQSDKPLMDGDYRGPSQWSSGQTEADWHLLPVASTVPPGEYRLAALVYDPADLAPLPTAEGTAATIGPVTVMGGP